MQYSYPLGRSGGGLLRFVYANLSSRSKISTMSASLSNGRIKREK